ncbi:hypothetical protein ACLOJK_035426 [Asimina triloba]
MLFDEQLQHLHLGIHWKKRVWKWQILLGAVGVVSSLYIESGELYNGDAGMGLWTLLEGFLLLANALAILNEDRFLAPRGWSFSDVSGGRTKSLKAQVIGLIYATQYMRLPLIAFNTITIIVMLVSG